MAKARPSVQKRIKEAKALERQQMKAARKAERMAARAERAERTDVPDGVDPDLVGLTVGPQPVPWHGTEPDER